MKHLKLHCIFTEIPQHVQVHKIPLPCLFISRQIVALSVQPATIARRLIAEGKLRNVSRWIRLAECSVNTRDTKERSFPRCLRNCTVSSATA